MACPAWAPGTPSVSARGPRVTEWSAERLGDERAGREQSTRRRRRRLPSAPPAAACSSLRVVPVRGSRAQMSEAFRVSARAVGERMPRLPGSVTSRPLRPFSGLAVGLEEPMGALRASCSLQIRVRKQVSGLNPSTLHPVHRLGARAAVSSGESRESGQRAANAASPVPARGATAPGSPSAGDGQGAGSDASSDEVQRLAAGAKAATEVEEREATRLLRAAEAALGLLKQRGADGQPGTRQNGKEGWRWWAPLRWPDSPSGSQDARGEGEEAAAQAKQEEARKEQEAMRADVVRRLAQVEDAQELLRALSDRIVLMRAKSQGLGASGSEASGSGEGVSNMLDAAEVEWLIQTALSLRNATLARSILDACRASSTPAAGSKGKSTGAVLQWPPVDIYMYSAYVTGVAALLRVRDALSAVEEVRRRGVPQSDEVPFGHVVECPTCRKPLIVIQPQYGRQAVPCAICRYEYELISGDLVSCDSESLLEGPSVWERALRLLRIKRGDVPVAVHSTVMKLPDGTSELRTFATSTPSVPAQEGERITLACAAPKDSLRQRRGVLGALRLAGAARAPGWRPGEPMQLSNHVTGQVLALLRAPPQSERGLQPPSWLLPGVVLVAATGSAGSALVDPSLPALIAGVAISSAAASTAATVLVMPQLSKLPEGSVAATDARQQLLKQYSALEDRLGSLTQQAGEEVRMLARMWQLQNKMQAVGEPTTYGARLERVLSAREGLEQRLQARLQLIDSYAKIAAMIEIEIEMDTDVPTAEAAGAAASIAEQIERLMEVESLQKEWRVQAEANDDVERLLRSAPPLPSDS